MAQAEIEKKEKRQREGIEAKKARGEWDDYGRPSSVDIEDFKIHYQKIIDGQMRPTELMKQLGISMIGKKMSFRKFLKHIFLRNFFLGKKDFLMFSTVNYSD